MKNRFISFDSPASTLSVALPVTGLVALTLVPSTVSAMTFGATAAIVTGMALVAINTWRNGQPTRSVAHVLNDVETGGRRE